jgi:hypothetical protein
MSYTYTTFVAALSTETNIASTKDSFQAILPTIIDQAEGMIYREPGLNFLSSVVTDDTGFTTADQQQFTLPRHFTILQDINLVVGNDRHPLIKTSREVLNFIYPSRIATGADAIPAKWAPLTDDIVLLGPTPGGTTQLECIGTVRPANLSASNPTPWLWTYLGDFAFAAAMFVMSGYMRNFGSQADDPKMAQSWKMVYDALLPGAVAEETRRKFYSEAA